VGGVAAATLEGGGVLQFLVGTERRVPAIDICSGRTGTLLRRFHPFPSGVTGVAHVRLMVQDGVPEPVVSDPGQGTVLLDARDPSGVRLSAQIVMLGGSRG
jgi:hypothetical protein